MPRLGLWLRWSWRDLRERWLQVTVIALIIALSTGVYVGLGSTTPWRTHSARASYALLHMYDLRVTFNSGSYIHSDEALGVVRHIPHASWIAAAEPRLILPTLVHVSSGHEDILARGRLIGVDVASGGPHVNGLFISAGRALTSGDSGQNVAIVEYHFADYYHLPPQGQAELSGGVTLDYVGLGMSPEYFIVTTDEGSVFAQANYAVIFVPLETAQAFAGHPGMINDLVIRLTGKADRATLRSELEAALESAFPSVGLSIMNHEDNFVYHTLFESIDMNQQIYTIMIVLFMAGALFGAFNLTTRLVEAQRRQIGIGMALGLRRRWLMVRPLLVGAQIAVLGAVFGIGLGLLVGKLAEVWMRGLIPMPVTGSLFQPGVFLKAAALGLVLPFVATLYPVWRAVRVMPVDAIRTGHLVTRSNGLTPLVAYIRTPGRTFAQMPIRNLLRSPRRALLTMLGITAAITTLVGLVGMLDGVRATFRTAEVVAFQNHPDRLIVSLNTFYLAGSEPVSAISRSPTLLMSEPAIQVPGTAVHNGTQFRVIIEALNLGNELWSPALIRGTAHPLPGVPSVLISEYAARALHLKVGDTFTLRLPRREGLFAFRTLDTEVQVSGLHADPWRTFVYMDLDQAGLMGLEGMMNTLHVIPAAGVSVSEAKNAMFHYSAVASVMPVRDTIDSARNFMKEVVRFLSGVEIGVIMLAFLIAFNSTAINMSERAREIATMFAFGLPVRTATRMAMVENLITGALGTLAGFGLGLVIVVWFFNHRMPAIVPDVRFKVTLSASTLLLSFAVGVGVVTLTPLLAMRRLKGMDIPSMLRVME
ncbi:MAG TPA: FtsX-like permease family protein [Aggregatilineaceae bacterium]|nr:FtsX-like permease family protein [Aggregatilineaceae bacterium]